MSLFSGGSGQPEPLLGRQAGAPSHLQATVPTLLQALSANESTVPRLVGKQARYRQASTGWLAEAGRKPETCSGAESGLRRASCRGLSRLGLDAAASASAAKRSPALVDSQLNPHGPCRTFSRPAAHQRRLFYYRCRSSSLRARARATSFSPTRPGARSGYRLHHLHRLHRLHSFFLFPVVTTGQPTISHSSHFYNRTFHCSFHDQIDGHRHRAHCTVDIVPPFGR